MEIKKEQLEISNKIYLIYNSSDEEFFKNIPKFIKLLGKANNKFILERLKTYDLDEDIIDEFSLDLKNPLAIIITQWQNTLKLIKVKTRIKNFLLILLTQYLENRIVGFNKNNSTLNDEINIFKENLLFSFSNDYKNFQNSESTIKLSNKNFRTK